jgi:hypothetical protein
MSKITWRVGKNEPHEIPDRAVVVLEGEKESINIWFNEKGEICYLHSHELEDCDER